MPADDVAPVHDLEAVKYMVLFILVLLPLVCTVTPHCFSVSGHLLEKALGEIESSLRMISAELEAGLSVNAPVISIVPLVCVCEANSPTEFMWYV
ncbi:hypothetical protein [Phascolarctobacterium sp.]|uniref:hypothetical protein n=1 Tax=Phascolarctobacterium sp. TaxID=2049039 RepID=UPI00386DCE88